MVLTEEEQMRAPAVSVIVPIYNVEKYLAECVDSILGQTFQDMEIILVDDGSLDSSGQMADDYAARDKRVKVIHKENGGLSSARNAGMKIARGEYIYFCDSDDYISLDAIEILYETATKNDLDMVLFNADSFLDKDDAENKALASRADWGHSHYQRRNVYCGRVRLGSELFAEMHANGEHLQSVCLQLIRREYCFEKELNFQEGVLHEDFLYTLKALLLADSVMFIPDTLFFRRVRVGSTMTRPEGRENVYGYFIAYCEILTFLSGKSWREDVLQEGIKEANECKNRALRIWKKLPNGEKARLRDELSLFNCIFLEEIIGNQKASKALFDIRHGYSFRIGRIVTWFPRKARGGIRCLEQHGLLYTLKRVLNHMGMNMRTK